MARFRSFASCLVIGVALIPALGIARRAQAQAPWWCGNPIPPPPPPPPPPPCSTPCCCAPGGPGGSGGGDSGGGDSGGPWGTGSPAYPATGTYSVSYRDLQLPAAGSELAAKRVYSSTRYVDGPFGMGWTMPLTARLSLAVYFGYLDVLQNPPRYVYYKQANITMPDGIVYEFKENPDGTWTSSGGHDTLVKLGEGSFDLTRQSDKMVFHFVTVGGPAVFADLVSMTDRYGNRQNLSLDSNGKLQQVADGSGSGRYITFYWGANGRVSSLQDSAGRQVHYGYDTDGYLSSVTDAAGRVMTYSYGTPGRFSKVLSKITDNWGRVLTDITYVASTTRVGTFTENGETFTYSYGNPGVAYKTDSAGNVRTYYYDIASGIITGWSAGGYTKTNSYNSDLTLHQHTDEVNVKTLYTYDSSGNTTSVTQDYQGSAPARYDYTYDPSFPGRVASITPKDPATELVNPNWQAWKYDYYQAESPAAGALHHVYRVESDGTTLDTVATYSYDSHGRLAQHQSAAGGVTDYGYDFSGSFQTVTGPANNDGGTRPVTTYGNFDGVGRPQTVTDPLGHTTTFMYDALGRVVTVALPKPSAGSTLTFTTTYSYDNFDAETGLLFTNVTDPNNRLTKFGYDQFGRLVRAVDANNKVTVYGYTKDLLTSVTDANNNMTSYEYNALKQLTRTKFPDTLFETYTYWPDGRLKTKTDRKNQTISYAYDSRKRLKTKIYPNSTSATYTYTGQKLTSVVDTSVTPAETHSFGYDTSYRVSSNTQATRGTLSYTYTAEDQPLTITGGPTSTYSYYPDGSLDTLTWSPVAQPFKYTYRLDGPYDTITFPNGQTRTYSYDDQGRLLQLGNVLGATNLATYAYGYDVDNATGLSTMLGQRTSLTANVPTQGFTNALTKYYYDSLYQLTRANYPNVAPFYGEVDSWTYDDIGNRLTNTVNGSTQTYTYLLNGSSLNTQRLQSDSVNSYTWDNNGSNLTRNGTPGNFTFGYNFDNRLNSISGAATAAYTYDYQGRRTSKTVSGVTTTYLYDGLNLVGETTGGVVTNYAFGPGIDEPLIVNKAGTISYFSAAGLGSVAGTNSAAGTFDYDSVFDAWGSVRSETGTRTNSFTYTGRETSEAGLHFYRARYYQSSVARFVAEDGKSGPSHPVAEDEPAPPDPTLDTLGVLRADFQAEMDRLGLQHERPLFLSPSVYAYTLNHPVRYNDPTGNDNPGCDGVPQCVQTPNVRHCCDLHDNCYWVHHCNSSSWYKDGITTPCMKCNWAVMWCLGWAPIQFGPVVPRNTPNPYPASYNQPPGPRSSK